MSFVSLASYGSVIGRERRGALRAGSPGGVFRWEKGRPTPESNTASGESLRRSVSGKQSHVCDANRPGGASCVLATSGRKQEGPRTLAVCHVSFQTVFRLDCCHLQIPTHHQHRHSVHAPILYDPLLHEIPQKRECRRSQTFKTPCLLVATAETVSSSSLPPTLYSLSDHFPDDVVPGSEGRGAAQEAGACHQNRPHLHQPAGARRGHQEQREFAP